MDVSVEPRWEAFIEDLLAQGRYASATDVVREGLRLMEEREAKLRALRETLQAAIAEGGETTDEQLEVELKVHAERLRARMQSRA